MFDTRCVTGCSSMLSAAHVMLEAIDKRAIDSRSAYFFHINLSVLVFFIVLRLCMYHTGLQDKIKEILQNYVSKNIFLISLAIASVSGFSFFSMGINGCWLIVGAIAGLLLRSIMGSWMIDSVSIQ
jgi:hypothetical protein